MYNADFQTSLSGFAQNKPPTSLMWAMHVDDVLEDDEINSRSGHLEKLLFVSTE
jgi:hypothetical protein